MAAASSGLPAHGWSRLKSRAGDPPVGIPMAACTPEHRVPAPPWWGRLRPCFLFWRFFLMATSWLNRLLKKFRPLSRSGRKELWRNRFLPDLEGLGDRIVPSTFRVTSLADAGAGSLRDAVAQANAQPGADTIDFQPGLTG